jgi:hypothetical protein
VTAQLGVTPLTVYHTAESKRPVVPGRAIDSFMKVYYGQTAILCWNICSRWYSKQRWWQTLKGWMM